MISAFGGFVLFLLAIHALRTESVSWKFVIPVALIPVAISFFLGVIGVLFGAGFVAALYKMNIRAMF